MFGLLRLKRQLPEFPSWLVKSIRWKCGRIFNPIAPFPFGRHQVRQSVDRAAFIWMMIDPDLAGTSLSAPLPDQGCTPEKAALHHHHVKAAQVRRRFFAP